MPAIISSALVIDFITEEFQQETLETLLSTPVTLREVVTGKVIASLLLVPLQGAAWLLLLSHQQDSDTTVRGHRCPHPCNGLWPRAHPARCTHRAPLPGEDSSAVHLLDGGGRRHPPLASNSRKSPQPDRPACIRLPWPGPLVHARRNAPQCPCTCIRCLVRVPSGGERDDIPAGKVKPPDSGGFQGRRSPIRSLTRGTLLVTGAIDPLLDVSILTDWDGPVGS